MVEDWNQPSPKALLNRLVPEVMRLKWLFVILTPFQYRMMRVLFEDALFGPETLIFYTGHVPLEAGVHQGACRRIDFNAFSLRDLVRAPFSRIPEYRKRLADIRAYLEQTLSGLEIEESLQVVIGTEKDNFTQVLLNLLYANPAWRPRLAAVEEGLGYYIKENVADRLISFMYKSLTPILFGEKLEYHKQLGTDTRIDQRYVRLPQSIPLYRGKPLKNLIGIQPITASARKEPERGKVLVFSFPNEDFGMDDARKQELFQALFGLWEGVEVIVKPHPRESVGAFRVFPGIRIMDRGGVGEDLDYFQYEQIVNFTSSVIIDILAQGYPAERITTIEMRKTNLPFFKGTRVIKPSELKKSKH